MKIRGLYGRHTYLLGLSVLVSVLCIFKWSLTIVQNEYLASFFNGNLGESRKESLTEVVSESTKWDSALLTSTTNEIVLEITSAPVSSESQSMALDVAVRLAKRQQQIASSEAEALLDFISSSKPVGFTNGEWEERVNVVLNVLRVQENYVPGLVDF